MLKGPKHVFGFTPVRCPTGIEDMLEIIGLFSLWGEAYGLVFVALCG